MKIAFKNFLMTLKRYKVASVLNIAGLTLAFAAFYVIASQVFYSLTYNRSLKDSERTFIVTTYDEWGDGESWNTKSPNPISYEIADAMPEVEAVASMKDYYFPQVVFSKVNDYHFEKFPYGITNCNYSITDIFDFNIIAGDIEDFNVENAIIISRSAAEMMNVEAGGLIYTEGGEWFDSGKPEQTFNIAAIFEDFEENTILSNRHIFLNDERRDGMQNQNMNYSVFVKLLDESDVDKFSSKWYDNYISWNKKRLDEYIAHFGESVNQNVVAGISEEIAYMENSDYSKKIRLVSLDDMYFKGKFDMSFAEENEGFEMGSLSTTLIMIAIALVIVIVAFINFVNFFMALVPVRMRAVNICKVFGAEQGTLRWNFVFEAIGLVIIALMFALYLILGLKDTFISNYVTCSLDFSDNVVTIIMVIVIAVAIAVIAAIYPAFYITKFNASMAVKGGFAQSKSGRSIRSILISTQFIVSMILMIVASVFFLQYRYMIKYDLGVDKENVLTFSADIPAHQGETFINKIESHAQIKEVTASLSAFFGEYSSINGRIIGDESYIINVWYVRHNLPEFFKMNITHGDKLRQPNKDVLINSYVNKGVGLNIGDFIDEGYEIKGIVDNIYNLSLKDGHVNSAYYCSENYNWFYIRTHENADIEAVSDFIKRSVKEIAPNAYEPKIEYLDDNLKRIYGDVKKQTILIGVFALIAIVISLMGIFGIVLFETQHRRREIGIRKVYGATTDNVITMFARRYAIIVGICFVIAAPVAWVISARWLEQFANRIAMPLWVYVLVLIVVFAITMTIVVLRSWKAANENPNISINN